MALTYVGGNSGTWAGATSGDNNVSLTALTGGSDSAAAAGDIVIAVYGTASTADRTLAIGDGTNPYTLAGSELYANTAVDSNLRVAYKVLSSADANCVFGPTGSVADAGTAIVHVWRGIDSTTPMDVTVVTATGTGSTYVNGASITPATAGAIVLVCGSNATGGGTGALISQSGSELSNFLAVVQSDTNKASAGIGSFAWTSGVFDPVVWTASLTSAGSSWAAVTLALRPATSVTHATTGALTGAGSTVAGTAAHVAIHATSGVLTGAGSTVTGTATRFRAHATSGALTGAGSSIAGTAARFRAMVASGILVGPGAVVDGAADSGAGAVTHDTSGALSGQGSTLDGTAARTRQHATSGVLSGSGAIIVGVAKLNIPHATDGALIGAGAYISGVAVHAPLYPDPADVRSGLPYGPGGIYTGTMSSGNMVMMRRR